MQTGFDSLNNGANWTPNLQVPHPRRPRPPRPPRPERNLGTLSYQSAPASIPDRSFSTQRLLASDGLMPKREPLEGITPVPYETLGSVFRANLPFTNKLMKERLAEYKNLKVNKVVVLVQSHEYLNYGIDLIKLYTKNGIEVLHFEIQDFDTPDTRNLNQVVNRIHLDILAGKNVVVHCRGGLGRTGMVLACLANRTLGKSAPEALAYVRSYVPGAAETLAQEDCIAQACEEEALATAGAAEEGNLVQIPFRQQAPTFEPIHSLPPKKQKSLGMLQKFINFI